jgi:poly(A) polymerase
MTDPHRPHRAHAEPGDATPDKNDEETAAAPTEAGATRRRRRKRGGRGRRRGEGARADAEQPAQPRAETHAHADAQPRARDAQPRGRGDAQPHPRGDAQPHARGDAHGRRHPEDAPARQASRAAHGTRHREAHEERAPHAGSPSLALDVPAPSPSHPPEIPEERLDAEAIRVIARLRHMGHQAYFVGGCVRDALLAKVPKDFDVATSAHPGEVRAIFRNCRLIGRRFRLAHVYFRGGKVIEVATFRTNPTDAAEDVPDEGDLLITRDNVFGTAEEDARRRDFTVNGLFYDVFAGEVIDYVGGRADLEAHRIATIGDPEIRMREDPVRALRAIRFASRLGFTIEPETFAAMRRHASELSRCAAPRLLEETFKILRCGASARAFDLLRTSGALPVLLPALASFLEGAPDDVRRRFAAHLAALDALVKDGEDPSEAVLLGALLIHLPPPAEPGAPNARDQLLAELVATARLPRRIAERTRLALLAQRALRGEGRRRKRRSLTGQIYFDDALLLLSITAAATGDGAAELERWREEDLDGDGGEEEARGDEGEDAHAGDAEGEAPGRRRRRRRGGRRRRRRGAGTGPGEAPQA